MHFLLFQEFSLNYKETILFFSTLSNLSQFINHLLQMHTMRSLHKHCIPRLMNCERFERVEKKRIVSL